MVEPRQTQLEDLDGDVVGAGSANIVVALTGSGGEISANGNVIKDVDTPVDGTDAVNKDYVDGAVSTPSLASVLGVGNTTGVDAGTSGNDIVISDGDAITSGAGVVTINDDLAVNGAATINGKLTVTGLIDPTGIILVPQASTVGTNSLWMETGANSSFLFTNSNNTDVFQAGEDSEPYIGVGGISNFGSSGALRVPHDSFVTCNDKPLIGFTTSDNNICVGDDGTGSGYPVTVYSSDNVYIRDPDGGSPKTRFTFGLGDGKLEFDNSNASASIEYETKSGSGNSFTIQGQHSLTSTGGALRLYAGNCTGGSGSGGGITMITGSTVSGSGGTFTLNAAAGAGSGSGGGINLTSGSSPSAAGGSIDVNAGEGGLSGGNINVMTGASSGGGAGTLNLETGDGYTTGGPINVVAGNGTNGSGGAVYLGGGDGGTWGGSIHCHGGDGAGGSGGYINLYAGEGDPGGGIEIVSGAGMTTSTNTGYIQTKLGSSEMTKMHAELWSGTGNYQKVLDFHRYDSVVDGPGGSHWRYVSGGRVVMGGTVATGLYMYDLWPD